MSVNIISRIFITILFSCANGSIVIDHLSLSQKDVHISDYCPKMAGCDEGMHVMCMNYNPTAVKSPRCFDPQIYNVTAQMANVLLDVINAMRSKIALGIEKGKGNEYLPKGYGMYRLVWDNELAAFAQLIADQCIFKSNYCAATKKFPDPGSIGGQVVFKLHDWNPSLPNSTSTIAELSESEVIYAITFALGIWYKQKALVTTDAVKNFPDFFTNSTVRNTISYMRLLNGDATHLGCGISAFKSMQYNPKRTRIFVGNEIIIICNISALSRKGTMTYKTVPPVRGTASNCGCPFNISTEDTSCLCNIQEIVTEPPIPKEIPQCLANETHCKPTVVLLPIFTFEDGPPPRLAGRQKYLNLAFDKPAPHSFTRRVPAVQGTSFHRDSKKYGI